MKKRLFNSKRKLLSLIALGVLLAFIISSGILAFFTHEDIKKEFDMYANGLLNDIDGYHMDYSNPEECASPESFFNTISKSKLYRHPTAIALYDRDGELLYTNGTLLSFRDDKGEMCICFLDDYISKSDLNKLFELEERASTNYIIPAKIRYWYDEKGRIVPVYCWFIDDEYYKVNIDEVPEDKKLKITFDVEDRADAIEIDVATLITSEIFVYEREWKDNELYKNKYYQLLELAQSEELRKKAYESFKQALYNDGANIRSFEVGNSKGSQYHGYQNLTIAYEHYFAVYATYYNPVIEVWDECGDWIQILALNFFLFGAIVIFATSKYYDKTKAFEESKNAFISAMTHEMKTPIAIIQNQCECVLENIAPEKNEEYLKSIYDETQKMDKLVTDMLQYNRIATNGNVNIEKCNLSDIVKAEVEKYKKQFELHEKNVTLNLKETAIVKCDRNLISLVVANMLSNTIKHTANGGEVIVTVKDGVEGYKVSVYNSGSTVPENEKDKIWSVLYKTDKSRTDRDKSSGVGLAVSAKILDLHKARYGCMNVNDGVEFYFNIK